MDKHKYYLKNCYGGDGNEVIHVMKEFYRQMLIVAQRCEYT